MPILSADVLGPCVARRILVSGPSGSGKTTLAARIGRKLGIEHVEIDALFHGPDWQPRPTFVADVEAFAATERWITEWQYGQVRELLADRADLVVWLDLPRTTVMRQVIGRTVCRRLHREELWNGNVEPPFHTFFTDPEHIVRWAWSTHSTARERTLALAAHRPELPVVRITSRADATRLVAHLTAGGTS